MLHAKFEPVHGAAVPVAAIAPGSRFPVWRGAKRMLDLALVLAAAPFVLPLLLPMIALIRASGGPVLFGHVRVGRDGRPFRCWKLRTMVSDADARLRRHLAEDGAAAAEWQATRKLARDPRITALGRALRKSSLDELPQLWNVFRGDMSLIGPRPVTAAELAEYDPPARAAYLALRPGITGLWQVTGRNALTLAERSRLDRAYAENFGPAQDLRILMRTVPVVLAGTGR